MPNYKELYFQLFAAMADAVEAVDHNNFGQARDILIHAQQNAEEQCITEDE